MHIEDKRTDRNGVEFHTLSIGAVYEDAGGVICIKTSKAVDTKNCIACVYGDWTEEKEETYAIVYPIETELVLKRNI